MKKYKYLAVLCLLSLASCGEKKDTTDNQDNPSSSKLDAIIVKTAPENARDIYTTRETAKAGDTITVHGKVMGDEVVLIPGRAVLTLGDPGKLTSCDLKPDDHCDTPWDVCCDDRELIKKSVLTVQVVDEKGNLVKSGFKGVAGIKELSELVVTGVVAEESNKDNLMLNATGIYVKP